METWIPFLIVFAVPVVSVVIQLCSKRKDKYQRIIHSLFYRTQRPGEGAWGLGPWYYGAWDVGEKLQESIAEGQARYSHQRPHRHHSQHKHHRKKR